MIRGLGLGLYFEFGIFIENFNNGWDLQDNCQKSTGLDF